MSAITCSMRLRNERARAQIPPVEVQQVEHVEIQRAIRPSRQRRLQIGEAGDAICPQCHQFTFQHGGRHRQAGKCLGDVRQPIGPIQPLAREQPDPAMIERHDEPVAAALDRRSRRR
jgi:hypothetical protein